MFMPPYSTVCTLHLSQVVFLRVCGCVRVASSCMEHYDLLSFPTDTASEGQEEPGNCHPGWKASTAEARPARPAGTGDSSLKGQKASAGEEDLESSGDESPEEDGESLCEAEAKEDGKAAPKKVGVPQAQHFKGRMQGLTRSCSGFVNKHHILRAGREMWPRLVGDLTSPACTSALVPPTSAQANMSLLFLFGHAARFRQRSAWLWGARTHGQA